MKSKPLDYLSFVPLSNFYKPLAPKSPPAISSSSSPNPEMDNKDKPGAAMEQLISMGFSHEQASQALAATGPNSTLDQAADWILTSSSSSQSSPSSAQSDLNRFFKKPKTQAQSKSPLSDRMRPKTLAQILGQDHLLSPTSILSSSLSRGRLPSLILWGPPGSGKTSIARAISSSLPSHRFVPLSAVTAGVKEVRDAVDAARRSKNPTVLFVDEIHRFSKSQLDSFLPAIEDGSIILVGATTENPSFHLTTPLLSRSRVLSLEPLKPKDLRSLLRRAVEDKEKGIEFTTGAPMSIDDDAIGFLSMHCDGDARVALNALETASTLAVNRGSTNITIDHVKDSMQCKHLAYDKDGEEHYNLISALHKSMRGNDANAAIYWLARMLEGGEQPLYIARRLVRFASEDVGLADPAALGQAVACYQACHFLGMPECDVNLAQCVAYLAMAPKSVAVYKALGEARRTVRESGGGNAGVPMHLRNAPTRLMKEFGYGEGYVYTPEDPEGSKLQSYLPPELQGRRFLQWSPVKEKGTD